MGPGLCRTVSKTVKAMVLRSAGALREEVEVFETTVTDSGLFTCFLV